MRIEIDSARKGDRARELVRRNVLANVTSLIEHVVFEGEENPFYGRLDYVGAVEETEFDIKADDDGYYWQSCIYRELCCEERFVNEYNAAQNCCEENDIDSEEIEILEFWMVTNYLADLLRLGGEIVEDVYGNQVWGRTTCGQAIYMDKVIQKIYDVSIWE